MDPQVPVTALYFAADDVALVGYSTGVVISVTAPFASNWTSAFLTAPAFGNAVVSFANRYGDLSDLYAATNKKVFRSNNRGVSWGDVTGTSSALASNLATGVNIAGMVRDANYPYLYVATGRIGQWITEYPGDASVFRSSTPVTGAWSPFAQGLPVGLPIVGIGLSPNKALYIATQGRGIWWRRDIAAVPPNSGLNAPANSASMVNTRQTITTTCSYPSGWHDIHTIDFKMAIGQGPEPGEPLAFWLQFDQDANLIRFYDADSDTWSAGAPGSSGVLSNRYTKLYLADTKVKGFGPTDPTVQVTWSVEFLPPAAGLELQQYLQVADDFGNITSWDKVGTWQVGSLLSLPLVTR